MLEEKPVVLSFSSSSSERKRGARLQPRMPTQVCISHDVNLNVNLTRGDFTSPAQV